MQYLPLDVLRLISLKLNWKDTCNLLKVNKRLYSLDNDNFWFQKMEINFGNQFIHPLKLAHHKANYLAAEQRWIDKEDDLYPVDYSKIKSNYLLKYHKDMFRLISISYDGYLYLELLAHLTTLKLRQYDLIFITNQYMTSDIWYVFFMPDVNIINIRVGKQIDQSWFKTFKPKERLIAPDFSSLYQNYGIDIPVINNLYLKESKYKFINK